MSKSKDALALWESICNEPAFQAYKVETDTQGRIILIPRKSLRSYCLPRIAFLLREQTKGLGWIGVELAVLTPQGIRSIDVSWTDVERINNEEVVTTLPTLCIEVLRPENTMREIHGKIELYFSMGAEEVWVVNPSNGSVFFFTSEDTKTQSNLFPGFRSIVDI